MIAWQCDCLQVACRLGCEVVVPRTICMVSETLCSFRNHWVCMIFETLCGFQTFVWFPKPHSLTSFGNHANLCGSRNHGTCVVSEILYGFRNLANELVLETTQICMISKTPHYSFGKHATLYGLWNILILGGFRNCNAGFQKPHKIVMFRKPYKFAWFPKPRVQFRKPHKLVSFGNHANYMVSKAPRAVSETTQICMVSEAHTKSQDFGNLTNVR